MRQIDLYHALAANIPDTDVYILNKNFKCLVAQGKEMISVGYNIVNFKGKQISEVISQREIEFLLPGIKSAFAGNSDISEFRYCNRWFQVEFIPLSDKGDKAYLCMLLIKNITEEKYDDETSQKGKMLYETIINTTATGYLVLDEGGRVVDANSEYVRLSGQDSLQIIQGRSPLDWTAKHDLARHKREIANSFRHGYVRNVEIDLINSNGRIIPVNINASAIENDDETKILVLCRDITFRKSREEKIKEQYHEIQNQYEELAATNDELISTYNKLNLAHDQLKESEESIKYSLEKERQLNNLKSRFISTVSHEFRTPLALISTNMQILEQYGEKVDPAKRSKIFHRIFEAVNSMSNMLDNISIMDKDGRKVLKFNPETFNFENYFGSLLDGLAELQKKNIVFELVKDTEIGDVFLDKDLLQHIVFNLLNNAIKFSPPGGKIFIDIKIKELNYLKLCIKDNGLGILDNELEYIQEPFHRGANVGNRKGMGMGLAIVKRCVDLSNGTISFESEIGKGTLVTVILPYKK